MPSRIAGSISPDIVARILSETSDYVRAADASSKSALASKIAAAASASTTSADAARAAADASAANASRAAAQAASATAEAKASDASGSATAAGGSMAAAAESAAAALLSEQHAKASENAAALSAANAHTSELNAAASESSASDSAANAHTSELNAAASETAAGNSADAAYASATSATNSASAASASETAAADSATLARSYTEGDTNTRPGEDTDNAHYYSDRTAEAVGQAELLKSQTQAIYDSFLAASAEYYVGSAYGYGLLVDNNVVSFTWMDPADNDVVKWRKTRLVMKQGGFPADETDGTVLVDNTVRNQYKTVPFVWDAGSSSDWYFALFTQSTGGAWNVSDSSPRFTTDVLTWGTIAMMSRAGTLLQYPGMAIGSVVDIPTLDNFPKLRWKLADVDYKGDFPLVSDFVDNSAALHDSIWIPNYLPCWNDDNVAWQGAFDSPESEYGANWDETFMSGRAYFKVVDAAYVQLTAGTDYENGASCADWVASTGNLLFVKNHANRKSNGCNIWRESNIRQRLNAVDTGWWTPQNPFDLGYGASTLGFMKSTDAWFTNLITPVKVKTALNTTGVAAWGGGGGYDITKDKVWLISNKEIFGTNNNNIAEGAQFAYFRDVANTAALRIQRDESGTARDAWLRSPYTGNVYYEGTVSTIGSPHYNNSSGSYAFLPAICLS